VTLATMRLMPRTLFSKIFIWSAFAQVLTLGSILALVTFYIPDSEGAINNAWSAYAHTAVVLLEKFGPEALDEFLTRTGEDTLLQLRLQATPAGNACAPDAPSPSPPHPPEENTTTIAASGLEGDYCLTVHATSGGLPETPKDRRSSLQIMILLELLSCAALSYGVARYLSRPISELRSAAARLAQGDLTARVGGKLADRSDEAAGLVREFDQMAERVADLIDAQRRLIGDISHEIKSPLARLSVALGLARRTAETYAPRQFDRMERELERLNMLSGELLTLARLEQGPTLTQLATVDLGAIVERVLSDATYESQTRMGDIALHGNETPLLVHGDEDLLRRAIENVVRNAIFYTPPGTKVEVALSCPDERSARLEIRDHGPGVPEAALQHLFEPFYRVDQARARKTGGAGVGLSICERAVRLHGGKVAARNASPRGLVVDISLPLAEAAAPEPATVAEMPSAPAPATAGDGVLLGSLRRLVIRGWPRLGRGTDAGRGAPGGVLTP
jgi:two-component system, OmpR family, sensor histidine kinase CpxA